METILFTVIMVVLWAINLLNGTNLGNVYHTTEILQIITAVLFAISFLAQKGIVSKKYFYSILFLVLTILISCGINETYRAAFSYIWVYMLIYILSRIKITEQGLRLTGICYAILGILILYIYLYRTEISTWNPNTIAMVGLFSYLFFAISFLHINSLLGKLIMLAVAAIYSYLTWMTDSRSCILIIAIVALFIFRIIPDRKIVTSKVFICICLLLPLFIAIFGTIFSGSSRVDNWNAWSMEYFGKELFSDRDVRWAEGFKQLFLKPWFGVGTINGGYWHNSAITCLVSYGVLGYVAWIRNINTILQDCRQFILDHHDTAITGCMVAFLLLYVQQSTELGLFASNPNLIPYLMLGCMLGRVNYLRKAKYGEL